MILGVAGARRASFSNSEYIPILMVWVSEWQTIGQKKLWSEENGQIGLSLQKCYGKSHKHSFQRWQAGKHLRTHNMVSLELDRLQQQKTSLGSTLISEDQESEVLLATGWPKLAT